MPVWGHIKSAALRLFERHGPVLGAAETKTYQGWGGGGPLQSEFHTYGVFPKIGVNPQIIHFNRVFHSKPSILGYPYFGNTHIIIEEN